MSKVSGTLNHVTSGCTYCSIDSATGNSIDSEIIKQSRRNYINRKGWIRTGNQIWIEFNRSIVVIKRSA